MAKFWRMQLLVENEAVATVYRHADTEADAARDVPSWWTHLIKDGAFLYIEQVI